MLAALVQRPRAAIDLGLSEAVRRISDARPRFESGCGRSGKRRDKRECAGARHGRSVPSSLRRGLLDCARPARTPSTCGPTDLRRADEGFFAVDKARGAATAEVLVATPCRSDASGNP